MTWMLALPVGIPLLAAALCIVAFRALRLQRAIVIAAAVAMVVAAAGILALVIARGPFSVAVGGWARPFAIELHADRLGAVMVLITAVLGAAAALAACADATREHAARGLWPLLAFLLMGVSGALLTADLFNLFVWFEVTLIASFVLLALGASREQLRASVVYVILNLISSTLFLVAVGLLYAAVRTVDFDELAMRLAELSATRPHLVVTIEALLLTSFGIKAAVFPLFFWLPASYHRPLPVVSALFAGLLTKLGFYAMIRVVTGIFPTPYAVFVALTVVAIATMLVGTAGALVQRDLRRILGFQVIGHIGFMLAALALVGISPSPRLALAAAIVYLVHDMVVKTGLFLVAGSVAAARGTESLDRLGGIVRTNPWLAAAFLVTGLSLAGVPPLSGFWAKLGILRASLDAEQWALAGVVIAASFLTLASVAQIWLAGFAGGAPRQIPTPAPRREQLARRAPELALAAIVLAIGLVPGPLLELAFRAADEILGGPP